MPSITPEAEAILRERFHKDCLIAIATAVENVPYVRTVDAFYENGAFYVLTHALSAKMQQMQANPVVGICGEWFTGHGRPTNLGWFSLPENSAIAAQMKTLFAAWIDNDHNDFYDPNTIILRITLTDGVLMANGVRHIIA